MQQTKKSPAGGFLSGLIGIGIIIFILIKGCGGDDAPKHTKNWVDMNSTEKAVWIKDYCDGIENVDLTRQIMNSVKTHFKHPREVEFDTNPYLSLATIQLADSGWVYIKGTGTGKNSFGVKAGFSYLATLEITQYTQRVVDVSVDIDE